MRIYIYAISRWTELLQATFQEFVLSKCFRLITQKLAQEAMKSQVSSWGYTKVEKLEKWFLFLSKGLD